MIVDADMLGILERLGIVSTWRGVAVHRRGGTERTLAALSPTKARQLARELRATPPGFSVMLHTPRCRLRNEHCRCGGARLMVGARA